jgi:hypothetical protein
MEYAHFRNKGVQQPKKKYALYGKKPEKLQMPSVVRSIKEEPKVT